MPTQRLATWRSAQVGCNGKRAVPDVSLDADPNSGVAVYDGTSYDGSPPGGWVTADSEGCAGRIRRHCKSSATRVRLGVSSRRGRDRVFLLGGEALCAAADGLPPGKLLSYFPLKK